MCLPIFSFGQLKQVARFENKQKESEQTYLVISMKKEGLGLFRALDRYEEGKRIWELVILDSNLQEKSKTELQLETNHNFIGYEHYENHFYFLFRIGETDGGDIHLVKVNIENIEITRFDIKHNFKFRLTHFCVAGGNVVIGGYVSSEPAILLFDPSADQLKILPGFFVTDTELLDLRTNQNGTFNTLTIERGSKDSKRLAFKTFTSKGEILLDDIIIIPSDKTILSGLTSSLIRDELILVGSYGIGNSKLASGIYSIMVDPFTSQPIQFYDFSQLENFFNYLSPKKAKKIKEKAEHNRLTGKAPSYKTNLIPIKIEETSEGFLFLNEIYHATSQEVNPTRRDRYGSPYGSHYPFYPGTYADRYQSPFYNNSVYSPYNSPPSGTIRMIESIVMQFSPQGELHWDEALELVDIKRDFMEQSSDITAQPPTILAYKNKDKVFYKTAGQDTNAVDTLAIRGSEEFDIVRNDSEEEGLLRHWFDGNFYVWGYQNLRNYSLEERNRFVFYIVKLSFE